MFLIDIAGMAPSNVLSLFCPVVIPLIVSPEQTEFWNYLPVEGCQDLLDTSALPHLWCDINLPVLWRKEPEGLAGQIGRAHV